LNEEINLSGGKSRIQKRKYLKQSQGMKNESLLTERILGAEKKNKTIHGSSAAELFQPQDGGSWVGREYFDTFF